MLAWQPVAYESQLPAYTGVGQKAAIAASGREALD